MSGERAADYLAQGGLGDAILVMDGSTATVDLAAQALGVEPARIAKTLAFQQKEGPAVIVMCGTARVDNKKYKAAFGCKAKMLSFEETLAVTGHPVGGVCPFGLPEGVKVYLDQSLRQFETVYPAAGSPHSCIKLTIPQLEQTSHGSWVDVAQD